MNRIIERFANLRNAGRKGFIVYIGAGDPDLIRSAKMLTAPTMDAAFSIVRDKLGDGLDVLVVPHALLTLPIAQGHEE